eukprot:6306510-Alexandrium_andersonii.AAC.1
MRGISLGLQPWLQAVAVGTERCGPGGMHWIWFKSRLRGDISRLFDGHVDSSVLALASSAVNWLTE